MLGLSLFSGAGIGETYLKDYDINIIVANEILEKRARLYKALYPECNMICGDITAEAVFNKVIESSQGVDFIIASPPCQGLSVAGRNRNQNAMVEDSRNLLVTYVIRAIEILKPKFVILENVPMLLKFLMPFESRFCTLLEALESRFSATYVIDGKVVDAADLGVPQTRLRAIIKMHPKGVSWPWPNPIEKKKTVRDVIGQLPSLEAGGASSIKWHFARPHTQQHIEWMRHTATGTSAFLNKVFYPKKANGEKIKGYESSYRRIKWDEPAPTITIRNDAISSQRNVHPGRLLQDGTYSDARVLTPYELMLLTSLPSDWSPPEDTSEILIRQVIGESIPPLMIKKIVGELECVKK